jgi:hypothetical protein
MAIPQAQSDPDRTTGAGLTLVQIANLPFWRSTEFLTAWFSVRVALFVP